MGVRNYQEKNGSYVIGQEGRYDPLYDQRNHRKSNTYEHGAQYNITRKRVRRDSVYAKKHIDKTIKSGTEIATLSYDKDRTTGTDMFYGAYDRFDKHEYNALFNKAIPQDQYDENGTKIGSSTCFKFRIKNVAKADVKVASEDSGANAFLDLYEKSTDFANFITDPNRMQSAFVDSKYKFKGYRESADALERIRSSDVPKESDLRIAYRMFNYVIPSDGGGNNKLGTDVAVQRARLFKQLKENGYGALLDTNDSIYGGFKTNAPVIVFDMEQIALRGAERVTLDEKIVSEMVFVGKKVLGI